MFKASFSSDLLFWFDFGIENLELLDLDILDLLWNSGLII